MKTQTFSRILASGILLAGLTACDARPRSQIDPNSRGALSILDALTKDGPEVGGVGDALLVSARKAEQSKDYNRAVQFYQQLSDKYPNNLEYQLGFADNLRRINKVDESVTIYDVILRRNPRHIGAMEGKGLALVTKGDFGAASNILETVIKLDSNRWRALNGVGLLFVAKSMPNEAVSYFDAALRVKPDHPTVLNNVGLTLALNGDYARAAQSLNRASGRVKAKSAERQQIDLNLALVLGLSGDTKRAEQVASRHLQGAALQNNLGFYAQLSGDDKLAKAYLNSALSGSKTFYKRAWENLENVN